MTAPLCPVCEEQLPDLDEPDNPVVAGNVAAAMGVPADAFMSIRADQARRRLEHELNRHMSAHTPQEWLPVLIAAKTRVAQLEALLPKAERP